MEVLRKLGAKITLKLIITKRQLGLMEKEGQENLTLALHTEIKIEEKH